MSREYGVDELFRDFALNALGKIGTPVAYRDPLGCESVPGDGAVSLPRHTRGSFGVDLVSRTVLNSQKLDQ